MERFVIGREEYGEVQFLLPVNLVNVDRDNLVEIEKGKTQVYGLDHPQKWHWQTNVLE